MSFESSFEPRSSISYDQLSSEVRPYADNLEAQVWAVFAKYGIVVGEGLAPSHTGGDKPRPYILDELKAANPTTEDLEHLADLLEQLDHIRKTGTPLERTKREIGETLLTITVKDAVNPWREALLAGLPEVAPPDLHPEVQPLLAERRDLTYNLKEVLEADIDSYRRAGLLHWAEALEELITPSSPPYPEGKPVASYGASLKGDVGPSSPPTPPLKVRGGREGLCLTPEQREIIETELKEGAIPIFMPGASTQLETTPEQYQTCFKPISVKESAQETTEPAYLWDHLKNLITNQDPSLTTNVPERPYLLLIKPTQAPDARTMNKTVDQQKAELEKIKQERQAPSPQPSPLKGEGNGELAITTLSPLDRDTWIRFIDLPLSSGGDIPGGFWSPVDRQLGFGRGGTDWGGSGGGFRFAVRVEI